MKTTERYYYTPIRMTKKYWQYQMLVRIWENRIFHTLLMGMQSDRATLGTFWQFLLKIFRMILTLESKLSYTTQQSQIHGIYPREMKTMSTQKLECKC